MRINCKPFQRGVQQKCEKDHEKIQMRTIYSVRDTTNNKSSCVINTLFHY